MLIINKIMQFYRYLIIKKLKLLNIQEYDKFKYGMFYQDRKLLKRYCINFFNFIDCFLKLF